MSEIMWSEAAYFEPENGPEELWMTLRLNESGFSWPKCARSPENRARQCTLRPSWAAGIGHWALGLRLAALVRTYIWARVRLLRNLMCAPWLRVLLCELMVAGLPLSRTVMALGSRFRPEHHGTTPAPHSTGFGRPTIRSAQKDFEVLAPIALLFRGPLPPKQWAPVRQRVVQNSQ